VFGGQQMDTRHATRIGARTMDGEPQTLCRTPTPASTVLRPVPMTSVRARDLPPHRLTLGRISQIRGFGSSPHLALATSARRSRRMPLQPTRRAPTGCCSTTSGSIALSWSDIGRKWVGPRIRAASSPARDRL